MREIKALILRKLACRATNRILNSMFWVSQQYSESIYRKIIMRDENCKHSDMSLSVLANTQIRKRGRKNHRRVWYILKTWNKKVKTSYLTASREPVSVQTRSGSPPLSGAICILHPVSLCNLVICSPPLPITAKMKIESVPIRNHAQQTIIVFNISV